MPPALTVIALLGGLTATEPPLAPSQEARSSRKESPQVSSDRIRLTREMWSSPRSGFYVTRLDALNPLIRRFNAQAGSGIVIRYARGDEGGLWAAELRAWLVALGIPSASITLVSMAQDEDALIIENHSNGVPPH